MESGDQALQRAIATISQSDPLTKLLEQVKLRRMKPTDAGLRAATGSWIGIYQKIIESGGFTKICQDAPLGRAGRNGSS